MARKFWTLMPDLYYTHKQAARGGRHEILFTAVGCVAYYCLYTSFHRKVEATPETALIINGKTWF